MQLQVLPGETSSGRRKAEHLLLLKFALFSRRSISCLCKTAYIYAGIINSSLASVILYLLWVSDSGQSNCVKFNGPVLYKMSN